MVMKNGGPRHLHGMKVIASTSSVYQAREKVCKQNYRKYLNTVHQIGAPRSVVQAILVVIAAVMRLSRRFAACQVGFRSASHRRRSRCSRSQWIESKRRRGQDGEDGLTLGQRWRSQTAVLIECKCRHASTRPSTNGSSHSAVAQAMWSTACNAKTLDRGYAN